jgi:hypothetical protein
MLGFLRRLFRRTPPKPWTPTEEERARLQENIEEAAAWARYHQEADARLAVLNGMKYLQSREF